MRIQFAVPDAHVSPSVLNAALEATTRANQEMLASGAVEPISEAIKHGEVKWKPEPFRDGEHFDLADTVQRRGWGDCDDLAPALAAELRHKGADDGARAIVRKSGPKRWHAITELSDGTILDPSEWAGMYDYKKKHGLSHVSGAGPMGVCGTSVIGLIADAAMLGVKPYGAHWAARCDLPVDGADSAICGVSVQDDPIRAIHNAVNSACIVGAASELVTPEDIARALAVRAAMQGANVDDVARALQAHISGEEVGSLFGSIFKGLKKIASPISKIALKAAHFLPIPGASLAAQAAESLLHSKGGGGHAAAAPGAIPAGFAPGLAAAGRAPATVQAPAGSHGPIIIKF
jgi:plasmid stability protein